MRQKLPFPKPTNNSQAFQNAGFAAEYLWSHFVMAEKKSSGKSVGHGMRLHAPAHLFSNFSDVIRLLEAFLRHCIREVFQIADESKIQNAKIVFNKIPLRLIPGKRDNPGVPVSWLSHVGDGVLQIEVDRAALERELDKCEESLPPELRNQSLNGSPEFQQRYFETRMAPCIAMIVLHEIGHIVLHCQPETYWKKSHIPNLRDDYEIHAWAFAGLVVGVALGDVAAGTKLSTGADIAWNYLARASFGGVPHQ